MVNSKLMFSKVWGRAALAGFILVIAVFLSKEGVFTIVDKIMIILGITVLPAIWVMSE